MKKVLLALAAVGMLSTAQAQFTKGGLLIYGTAGVSNDDGSKSGNKSTEYFAAPAIGYNIIDNLTVGITIGYTGSTQDAVTVSGLSSFTLRSTTNQFNVGPFIRKTYPLGDIFFVYGQLGGDVLLGKVSNETRVNNTTVNGELNRNGFDVNLFPGVGMYFKKGWALNFAMGGANYTSLAYEGADANGVLNVTVGQQFNLSVSKNLGGHHRSKRTLREPMDETRTLDTSDDDDAPKKTKLKVKVKSDDDDE